MPRHLRRRCCENTIRADGVRLQHHHHYKHIRIDDKGAMYVEYSEYLNQDDMHYVAIDVFEECRNWPYIDILSDCSDNDDDDDDSNCSTCMLWADSDIEDMVDVEDVINV